MENNDIEYLKKTLKFLGFGTSLNAALEAKISENLDQFKIGVSADFNVVRKGGIMDQDKVNYELNFSRSNENGSFDLTSYKTTLNDQLENTFQLGKGNDITAKEAYNLLRGASIKKKAIMTDYLKLIYVDESGKQAEELKVSSTDEAKNIIVDNIKNGINQNGKYEVSDKGFLLRTYDAASGKDLSLIPEGKIVLQYSFLDKNSNQPSVMNFILEDFRTALETKEDLVKNPDPNHEISDFKILNESRTITLYNFDRGGNELPIVASKRSENIWVKLDFENQNERGDFAFKRFYQNYGFDLETELRKFPIRQLGNEKEKSMLMASLGRGNTQKATLETGQSVLIEADPQFKKVQFYDLDYQKISIPPSQSFEINR